MGDIIDDWIAPELRVHDLVVDPHAGSCSSGRKPVYGHPGQDLVVCPGVAVAPVVKFFVDPREQGDGAGREPVAERLRLRGLHLAVSRALGAEFRRQCQSALFGGGVGCVGVLEEEEGG